MRGGGREGGAVGEGEVSGGWDGPVRGDGRSLRNGGGRCGGGLRFPASVRGLHDFGEVDLVRVRFVDTGEVRTAGSGESGIEAAGRKD